MAHAPFLHVDPAAHWFPQRPQLFASFLRSEHAPLQTCTKGPSHAVGVPVDELVVRVGLVLVGLGVDVLLVGTAAEVLLEIFGATLLPVRFGTEPLVVTSSTVLRVMLGEGLMLVIFGKGRGVLLIFGMELLPVTFGTGLLLVMFGKGTGVLLMVLGIELLPVTLGAELLVMFGKGTGELLMILELIVIFGKGTGVLLIILELLVTFGKATGVLLMASDEEPLAVMPGTVPRLVSDGGLMLVIFGNGIGVLLTMLETELLMVIPGTTELFRMLDKKLLPVRLTAPVPDGTKEGPMVNTDDVLVFAKGGRVPKLEETGLRDVDITTGDEGLGGTPNAELELIPAGAELEHERLDEFPHVGLKDGIVELRIAVDVAGTDRDEVWVSVPLAGTVDVCERVGETAGQVAFTVCVVVTVITMVDTLLLYEK